MINGTREDAERLREEAAAVLAPMGLRLSPAKTLVTHIDDSSAPLPTSGRCAATA